MIKVRIMLPEGERKFRKYISDIRQKVENTYPDLNIEPFSRELSPQIEIDETKIFNTKLELAEYLDKSFKDANIKRTSLVNKNGLWTWLSYIWFNQFAPVQKGDFRDIKEEAKYICSSDYRDYYRHLVAGPYSIYSLHGREGSQIFLYSPVYEHNDFIEQFASRQFIISHRNIVEAITKLYFNNVNKKPKRGAQSRKRNGNIRRFVSIIQQFELTYDIYSMSSDQILDILPPEFDEWKHSGNSDETG